MKSMSSNLLAAWDAFNNPDSPWYYVVAIIFLVLIFAALGIYMVYAKKHKKPDDISEDKQSTENKTEVETADAQENETAENAEVAENAIAPNDGEIGEISEEEKKAPTEEPTAAQEPVKEEEHLTFDAPTADEQVKTDSTAEKSENDNNTEKDEKAEEPTATGSVVAEEKKPTARKTAAKSTGAKTAAKTGAAKTAATKTPAAKSSATKTTASKQTTAKSTATKSTTAKSSAKKNEPAFIDKLIEEKSVHLVYNELKNTILSYPGIKAKLNKDGEGFFFGEEKKAGIALDGGKIELYLYVDPSTVPEQFGAENVGGELPTKLTVEEDKIDGAQRLIFFAMNVAMLTRNASRRYVDYVQNAINAKNRAKKK